MLALKLYGATSDKRYLEKGRRLYDWTKRNLQDPEDGLYFDNINLKGEIGRSKFAYNTGQMIEAAVLLYRHTGKRGICGKQNVWRRAATVISSMAERDWMRRVVSVC